MHNMHYKVCNTCYAQRLMHTIAKYGNNLKVHCDWLGTANRATGSYFVRFFIMTPVQCLWNFVMYLLALKKMN